MDSFDDSSSVDDSTSLDDSIYVDFDASTSTSNEVSSSVEDFGYGVLPFLVFDSSLTGTSFSF